MVHNPGGDWHPGWGVVPMHPLVDLYMFLDAISRAGKRDILGTYPFDV